MKNKKIICVSLASTAALLLGGCAGGADVTFWAPFGSGYTTQLEVLVQRFNESDAGFTVGVESAGSYQNLQKNINNSLATRGFPNFTLGYPDHFAGYIKSGIMIELDGYVKQYDIEHKAELEALGYTSILDDFYQQYMTENYTLKYKGNTDEGYLMGIPFNKSTELLSYNGYMWNYVVANSELTDEDFPNTYAEWATVGATIRQVVLDNLAGKVLFGTVDEEGTASNFEVKEKGTKTVEGKKLLLDCQYVNSTNFRVFSWNDLDNMFITLVRQFGGKYTEYTKEDRINYKKGFAVFFDGENKQKTIDALTVIDNLYKAGIFGTKKTIDPSAKNASDPFKNNLLFGLVSSSGGLSYNVSQNDTRVRLHTIPYQDETHKYVISQGTNFGLLDQGTDLQLEQSFKAMIALSTGEMQGEWAATTGYYPATKSAYNSEAYQNFLKTNFNREPLKRAYKESTDITANIYRYENEDVTLNWEQFVDPGFAGSSTIRDAVEPIVQNVISRTGSTTIESVVQAIVNNLASSGYTRK